MNPLCPLKYYDRSITSPWSLLGVMVCHGHYNTFLWKESFRLLRNAAGPLDVPLSPFLNRPICFSNISSVIVQCCIISAGHTVSMLCSWTWPHSGQEAFWSVSWHTLDFPASVWLCVLTGIKLWISWLFVCLYLFYAKPLHISPLLLL